MERIAEVADRLIHSPRGIPVSIQTPRKPTGTIQTECTCGGIGWLRVEVPYGDPQFGKLIECICQTDPKATKNKERMYRESGLTQVFIDAASWSNFYSLANTEDAIKALRYTAQNGGWCYLWGGYGQGKSDMLRTVAARLILSGRRAHYTTWSKICDALRAAYNDDTYDARVKFYALVPCLCIDELCEAKHTDWELEAETKILKARYDSATGRAVGGECTIMASNAAPETFAGWLCSRMREGTNSVVHLTAKDYRPQITMPAEAKG